MNLPWKATTTNPTPPPLPPAPRERRGGDDGEEEEEAAAALSISDRRTLYLVNIFIGNTVRFLNSFSAVCEEKLADVHRRILRLDATLTLLEAKLSSSGGGDDRDPEHGASSSSSYSPAPHDPDSSTDPQGE